MADKKGMPYPLFWTLYIIGVLGGLMIGWGIGGILAAK